MACARPGGEIRALTGLRGIAATLVMLDRYAELGFEAPFPLVLLPHMYLAVDIFMVLSGFVLAMSYEDRFAPGAPPGAFRFFLARRVARLYPLYAFGTVVCFGLCLTGWLTVPHFDTSWPSVLANVLAVQTWAWLTSSFDLPGWSISAEWAASLLFAMLLPLFLFRPMKMAVTAACAAAMVLTASAALGGQLFFQSAPFVVNTFNGPATLGRCVSEFALGLFAWRMRRDLSGAAALGESRALLLLLAVMVALMRCPQLDVLFVLLSVLLIVGLSYDRPGVARWLGAGAPRWLGEISYSIYLLHIALLPIRDWLAATLASSGLPGTWPVAVVLAAALTLAIATLTYRWVEIPAQHWLNALTSLRPRHTVLVSAQTIEELLEASRVHLSPCDRHRARARSVGATVARRWADPGGRAEPGAADGIAARAAGASDRHQSG